MNVKIRSENLEIEAEVAESFFEKIKGLSFRKEGKMLFIFQKDTKTRIDMAFLSEPLFLYFMDKEKKVISIKKAEPWGWSPFTWRTYRPTKSYRYLLESFESLDIEKGEVLEFQV